MANSTISSEANRNYIIVRDTNSCLSFECLTVTAFWFHLASPKTRGVSHIGIFYISLVIPCLEKFWRAFNLAQR